MMMATTTLSKMPSRPNFQLPLALVGHRRRTRPLPVACRLLEVVAAEAVAPTKTTREQQITATATAMAMAMIQTRKKKRYWTTRRTPRILARVPSADFCYRGRHRWYCSGRRRAGWSSLRRTRSLTSKISVPLIAVKKTTRAQTLRTMSHERLVRFFGSRQQLLSFGSVSLLCRTTHCCCCCCRRRCFHHHRPHDQKDLLLDRRSESSTSRNLVATRSST